MKRGQIYYIESNHQEIGSEQRTGRPAVIVSNDKNNENSTTVEVVYMTTQPKNDLPTHVFIRSSLRPSTVLCEQIYSVSTERLGTYIGELTDRELQELDIALSISLGLDWMQPETSRGGCQPEDLEAMQQQLTETEAKLAAVTAELAELKNQPDYKLLYDQLIEKLLDR